MEIKQGRMSIFKKEFAFDICAYLGFIAFYFIAYRDMLLKQVPFWALNLSLPISNSRFYLGQFYWFPGNLGSLAQPNLATWLPHIFVQLSGNNLVLAEKLLASATLVSCFTMYFFLSNHFEGSRLASFSAALIYGFGPATVLDFTDFTLWGYAAIPIVFNYMLNLLEGQRKIEDVLLLGLSLSFLTAFTPQILPVTLISLLVFLALRMLPLAEKLKYFRKVAVSFSLAILVFVMTSPYLISGAYQLMIKIGWVPSSGIITSPNLASSSQPGLYLATYANQEIVNTIRLIGGSPGNHLPESSWIGFVLPILAFASLLLVRRGKKMLNLLALTLVSIVIITIIYGIHLHADWAMWLLYHTPISLFYYPERPLYVVTFAYCVMICVTVEVLLNAIGRFRFSDYFKQAYSVFWHNSRKIISILIVVLLLASVFLFAPVFDEQLHQERYNPLPQVYFSIQDWLNSHNDGENYRVMFLPTDSFSTILGDPDVFECTSGYAFSLTQSYVDFVYNQLVTCGTNNLGSLLAPASVKYIILAAPNQSALWSGTPALNAPLQPDLSGPVRYTNGGVQGNPVDIEKILDEQSDLKLVYADKDFRVYENMMYLPKVSVFSSATYIVGSEDALSILPRMPDFSANTDMLIFANQNPSLAKELVNASSSILFFNTDVTDYAGLLSLPISTPTVYEDTMNQIGLKNQLYLFTQNSSTFSRLVTMPTSEYWIAITGYDTPDNLSEMIIEHNIGGNYPNVNVDGVNINSAQTPEENGWGTFGPVCLQSGTHNFTITNGISGSLIAVYNTANLAEIFNGNGSVNCDFSKLGETSYKIEVNANEPLFISLSESYYPNWLAYSEGRQLVHFTAFSYSNGFYLNRTGVVSVTLQYEPPLLNQVYVAQQILFAATGLFLIATPIARKIINKNKEPKVD